MKNLILTLGVLMICFTFNQAYSGHFLKIGDFKAIEIGKDSLSSSVIFKVNEVKNGTVNKLTKAELFEEIDHVTFLSKKNKERIKNSVFEKDGEWYFKINRLLYKLLKATVIEEDEVK